MAITREEVRRIALLARLQLTPDEESAPAPPTSTTSSRPSAPRDRRHERRRPDRARRTRPAPPLRADVVTNPPPETRARQRAGARRTLLNVPRSSSGPWRAPRALGARGAARVRRREVSVRRARRGRPDAHRGGRGARRRVPHRRRRDRRSRGAGDRRSGARAARRRPARRRPGRAQGQHLHARGSRRPRGSRILEGFVPPYDATVVARLRDGGRGHRRQDQLRRVRDGLVDRELRLRRHAQSVGPASACRAGRAAARPPRSRPASALAPRHATPAGRSASRRRSAASSGSSRPTGACRATALIAFASSLDQVGPLGARRRATARCSSRASRATTRATRPRSQRPVPTSAARSTRRRGHAPRHAAGVLRRRLDPEVVAGRARGARALLETLGAAVGECRCPHTEYAIADLLPDRDRRGELEPRALRRRALRPRAAERHGTLLDMYRHPRRGLRRRGEAARSCSAPTRSAAATTTRTT